MKKGLIIALILLVIAIVIVLWWLSKKSALSGKMPENLPVTNNPLEPVKGKYWETNPDNWNVGDEIWNISDKPYTLHLFNNVNWSRDNGYDPNQLGTNASRATIAAKSMVGRIAAIDGVWMRFEQNPALNPGQIFTQQPIYLYKQQVNTVLPGSLAALKNNA